MLKYVKLNNDPSLDDTPVLEFRKISLRHRFTEEGRIDVAITNDPTITENSEEDAKSDKIEKIDIILSWSGTSDLDWFINYLEDVKDRLSSPNYISDKNNQK